MKRFAILVMSLFIVFALLSSGGVVIAQSATIASTRSGNWSDASVWNTGSVPASTDSVSVSHVITANVDSTIAGLTIATGGELRFSPTQSTTLQSTANVIVRGKLAMRPATPAVVHILRFTGINEANFAGGGMDVLATDVGLWVMDDGQLDIAGSAKTSWTHAAGSVSQGATTVTLKAAPVGWQVGDEISIVPTEPTSVGDTSWSGFEKRTITAINGATVTLNAPTARAHPIVINPFDGSIYAAEVLNLTRNTRIEGIGNGSASPTANGRAHIFIRSTQPQSIKHLAIRYMGPRKPDGSYTADVLGRYGLHFHMSGDGSRGSIVEGVVVRDTGSHAFVPHASHGITFQDTISYNTFEDAYWWDASICTNCGTQEDMNDSHDITIDHAVAALLHTDPTFRGYRLTGFFLARGDALTNSLRNSVAVGVRGNTDASGFLWPEEAHGLWVFEDNIAHNNKVDGIFAWQNNVAPHTIDGYVAYHNGGTGIDHGAYDNAYQYLNVDLFANKVLDMRSRAASSGTLRSDGYAQAWVDLRLTGRFGIAEHTIAYMVPTLVKNCIVDLVTVSDTARPIPSRYDFVNCVKLDGTNLEATDFALVSVWPDSRFRVQNQGTAWQLAGDGTVTTIAPFYIIPLSELAQQVKDILDANPDVRQELIDAGIINGQE